MKKHKEITSWSQLARTMNAQIKEKEAEFKS